MDYRTLGGSGAVVSAYALGTMTFGDEADEDTSRRLMSDYVAAGGNFFDTANVYSDGTSEEIVGRALADKSRAVRIPVHMLEAQQQLAKVQARLVGELGRDPTPGELAEAAKLPMAKLNQMHRYLMGQPMSLDRPIYDDDDRAFGDLLADPDSEESSPVDDLTHQALTDHIERLMDDLSPIEADVLRQRFGLVDDEERTFREIGDQYDLSRERIRQIQNAALGKLRRALERNAEG